MMTTSVSITYVPAMRTIVMLMVISVAVTGGCSARKDGQGRATVGGESCNDDASSTVLCSASPVNM